jgi:hypothetical protein
MDKVGIFWTGRYVFNLYFIGETTSQLGEDTLAISQIKRHIDRSPPEERFSLIDRIERIAYEFTEFCQNESGRIVEHFGLSTVDTHHTIQEIIVDQWNTDYRPEFVYQCRISPGPLVGIRGNLGIADSFPLTGSADGRERIVRLRVE